MNPVARRELQERFRTLRSPLLISVWVLALGVLTFLSYLVARSSAETRIDDSGLAGLGSVFAASSMGPYILHAVLLGLLTAAVFVVPGQAAVAIVGERERQTLPLLQVSQLSGTRIVVGKLASSLAFTLLLLVVALPLLVVPVLLGGVTVGQAVMGVVMVAGTAITIGAVSMWISARARSVQGAVLGSYVVAAVLVFGGFALVAAEVVLLAPDDTGRTRYSQGIPRDEGRELYSAWVNPYLGLVDASSEVLRFGAEVVPSPYQPFRSVLIKRQGFAAADADVLYDPLARYADNFGGLIEGDRAFPMAEPAQMLPAPTVVDPIRGAIWWRVLVFQALVAVLALWRASRLVTVPRQRVTWLPGRNGRGPVEPDVVEVGSGAA
jgi:ABC-type transport system involved in multi-copper enzyme maturation permease subunit